MRCLRLGLATLFFISFFVSGLDVSPCWAADTVSSSQSSIENSIASKIHRINQMEMKAGELAKDKGTTEQIQSYADRIVRDHTDADQKLLSIAEANHFDIIQSGAKSKQEQRQLIHDQEFMRKLQTEKGSDFDQTYLKGMVEGHKQAIQMLSQARDQLPEDSSLRDYVDKMLPILGHHHELAVRLERKEDHSG